MDKDTLQVENGNFTRIVNPVLDALVSTPISGSELRIVFAVIRKTYGFQKSEDSISLSQLQEKTGISKRNIIYLLQNLEAKKILIISREKQQCNLIRFNKYIDTWVVQNSAYQVKKNRELAKVSSAKLRNEGGGGAKLRKMVVQNSVKKVESFAHTKERKKEIKERLREDAPTTEIWNLEEKLLEMEKKENGYLDIISTFIREKKLKIENGKALSAVISRYARVAQTLSGAYTNQQIFQAIKKIKSDNEYRAGKNGDTVDWTIETIYKQLTK